MLFIPNTFIRRKLAFYSSSTIVEQEKTKVLKFGRPVHRGILERSFGGSPQSYPRFQFQLDQRWWESYCKTQSLCRPSPTHCNLNVTFCNYSSNSKETAKRNSKEQNYYNEYRPKKNDLIYFDYKATIWFMRRNCERETANTSKHFANAWDPAR